MAGKPTVNVGDIFPTKFYGDVEIIEYHSANKVIVKFKDTGTIRETRLNVLRNGSTKDPYKPKIYGVGYFGEGQHKAQIKGKTTLVYNRWSRMLERCYNPTTWEHYPQYKDCSVDPRWHNFQTFADWFVLQNAPEDYQLDKDIKIKGNKIYGPDTCVLVSAFDNANEASNYKRYTVNVIHIETGIEYTVFNQSEFCREMGIKSITNFNSMLLGRLKTSQGYRLS